MTTLMIPIKDDHLAWFDEQAVLNGYENAREYFGELLRSYGQRQELPPIGQNKHKYDLDSRGEMIGVMEAALSAYEEVMETETPLTDRLTGVLSENVSDNWRDEYVEHILEKHA